MTFDQPVASNYINDLLKSANFLGVPSPTAVAKQAMDTQPVGARARTCSTATTPARWC